MLAASPAGKQQAAELGSDEPQADATAAATSICIDLRFSAAHHPLWMRWERRLDLLMPAGYQRSVFMAVIFPEVAALAAVLAAPGWQTLAASDAPADADCFLRAAQNALGCVDPPPRHDISDAVTIWMGTRAGGPPLQPASIHPDTGHHDDGTPRVADQQRLAERLTVIHFGRDRRAPRTPKSRGADALRPPAHADRCRVKQ